jgi:hypothetical protein
MSDHEHHSADPAPMGPRRLAAMIEPSFSGIYLTLLSIIQSVALGFLAVELNGVLSESPISPMRLVLVANTFLLLVVVWYGYLEGLLSLYWTPSIVDSLLPFGIGLSECSLATSSDDPAAWFVIAAIISILGCFVNLNALHKTRDAGFESKRMQHEVQKRSRRSAVFRLALGVLVLPAMAWCSVRWPSLAVVPASLILVFLVGMTVTKASAVHWPGMADSRPSP